MNKTDKLMAAHAPPAITDILACVVRQAIRYESKQPGHPEREPGGERGTQARGLR